MKLKIYTIAADLENTGIETFAFASDAERDAWAWENVVAKNLKENDDLADGTLELLEMVKDAFPTAYDAIGTGDRKGYEDGYVFGEHEIEVATNKIKLYTVQGDHFSNPGHIMKHFTDKTLATQEAVSLVNIMFDDTEFAYPVTPPNESTWEDGVGLLQDMHGEQYCDVWIDESEIEVPAEKAAPAYVRKFLDLSNSHLSQDAAKWLDEMGEVNAERTPFGATHLVATHHVGWFMYAGHDDAVHADLKPIVALAKAKGCDYINFDADASVIDALPVYEWEENAETPPKAEDTYLGRGLFVRKETGK